jgi:hypothetical protein
MDLKQVGKWSFIAGMVVAVLAGLFVVPYTALVLFVLGLVVGFLNVTVKETEKFLIAAIALIVLGVASIQTLSVLGMVVSDIINAVLANFIAFVGASALVVAVKAVIEIGK